MISEDKDIGLGVLGFGGFAFFAVQHIVQIPGVKLAGFASTHSEAAHAASNRFGVTLYDSIEEFLESPDIDVVYIATPPFLHYEQSMACLKAGKHVICEKPLATRPEHAVEMVETARERDLVLAVNLMQRYNPVYHKVKQLIDSGIMGEVLHAYFENYASDEFLAPDHWFWDRERSGGIFIEHGVHFFDMFEGWFGKGKIVSAQSVTRSSTGAEEQVQCQALYNNITANFYHGFTQPARMDRQELRILFEMGEITLYEWVPYKVYINTLADEYGTKVLTDLFPNSSLSVNSYFLGMHREMNSRHKERNVYQHINMKYGFEKIKMNIYGDIVKELFTDQLKYIKDRAHKRVITEQNGLNSFMYAYEASLLSKK